MRHNGARNRMPQVSVFFGDAHGLPREIVSAVDCIDRNPKTNEYYFTISLADPATWDSDKVKAYLTAVANWTPPAKVVAKYGKVTQLKTQPDAMDYGDKLLARLGTA